MLNDKLINPKNIVIVGASNNLESPGGRVLKNLIDHNFKGELIPVNPKESQIQGLKCFKNVEEIPDTDLAIIAIASKYCLDTVKVLCRKKNTKGFIIFSAGFSETSEDGKKLEVDITKEINTTGGSLLGPNNIGLINQNYAGVFTTPIPKLNNKGVDFISGSGATAVFFMEAAHETGLTFNSVFSVGNSAQIGVEEVLEYLDLNFDEQSSKIKLLYIESINNPQKLLKHASSLIQKGCKIAAIKAGSSEEGSKAASSHTGALASSDVAVDALFKKAGIIRCYGRNELIMVAAIISHPQPNGKNFAIITHAGGPAVMLTDSLAKNGLKIPEIKNEKKKELLELLYPGSSVANPIDFLATGTAEQLETIIDYCENDFSEIDAMVIIFGSPGLFNVEDVYNTIDKKKKICKKPIFAILPSVMNAKIAVDNFIAKGNISFSDEVLFGSALGKVMNSSKPNLKKVVYSNVNNTKIRAIIKNARNGYLHPIEVKEILEATQVPIVKESVCKTQQECIDFTNKIGFPVVMKVVGPIHKSDIGGIILNINSERELNAAFNKIMCIKGASSALIQPMKKGIELFIGAKMENNFGHLIMCGMGGIYIEVLKDVQTSMAPVTKLEAKEMIQNLKTYKIIQGVRNQKGIDKNVFAEIIEKISNLVRIAPEIIELDLNPLLANPDEIIAVDARIRIEKNN